MPLLSVAIISATSRTISISIENEVGPYGLGINNRIVSLDVLQTNAAVSPGNSGGGLFNAQGELIGIVNAKSSGENQEGLGFAIPVNTAQEIAVSLINTGSYTPPNTATDGKGAVLEIAVVEIAPAAAHMNNREPGVYVQSVKEPCVGEKDATQNKELFQKERKIILELYSKSGTFG